MTTLLRRLTNLWKLSEFEPQFGINSPNVRHQANPMVTMLKRSVPNEEGSVIAPDRSKILNNLDLKIDDLLT